MSPLTNTWENARAWWQTATPVTRAAATATVLLLVIGLIAAVTLSASPDYTPIYRNVSGKDAAAIENTLREHNIPMRYSDKDQSVSVPSKDESTATMYVEAAGVLSKDAEVPGIEMLDKIGMETDTEVERERIRAANEGELARMLMRLDAVETAAVKITEGSSSSLFSSEVTPTASVFVGLRPGQSLDAEQVKGIVYLVARAVPNLNPKDINLTDQTGVSLWRDNGLGGNALGDGQPLDESAKFAEAERRKLQGLLDDTLGQHKALVTVNAELDFDQTQIDKTEHLPTAPGGSSSLPLSVDEKEETYTGSGAPPVGGVAGTGSNLNAPSYAAGGGSGAGGAYKNTHTTTNYLDNTSHTITQTAPGGIKKLTVATLVDSSVPAADAATIQRILSTAIGVTPGDATRLVTVQQLPFDTSAQKLAQSQIQAAQSQQLWGNVARALAAVAVAAVLLFLLTRSGRRAAPQLALAGEGANIGLLERDGGPVGAEEAMLEERPLRIEDVLAEMPEVMPSSRPRRRPQAQAIEEQPDLKLEGVQELIATSPQSVALLLKGWMYEESRAS
ncbi:MAG: flagellar M-ring protein FliF [Armatimonadetes bacterium]|nr:flagellar M-ring protein FliF [Armatimonadota bacterium]